MVGTGPCCVRYSIIIIISINDGNGAPSTTRLITVCFFPLSVQAYLHSLLLWRRDVTFTGALVHICCCILPKSSNEQKANRLTNQSSNKEKVRENHLQQNTNKRNLEEMYFSMVRILSFFVICSPVLVANTDAAYLHVDVDDEDLNFLHQKNIGAKESEDSSFLDRNNNVVLVTGDTNLIDVPEPPPSGCPHGSFPGVCEYCRGDGCKFFDCSVLTTWRCPFGYKECGYETCALGFCPGRIWCSL